jgi:hypothetical protein
MKTRLVLCALMSFVGSLALLNPSLAQDSRWDELANAPFHNGYPTEETRTRLLDELYFQHAVQVYLSGLPAVNMLAIRDGSEAKFGSGYNILPTWKKRMDAKAIIPTPNADVIYAQSYLDLKKDGPLVVVAPPSLIGMFTGDYLIGDKIYRLHLPPNVPAALFWSITAYDPSDGRMIDAGQPFPSINSMSNIEQNADGSYDLYFGPQLPAGKSEANWIKTIPGQGYVLSLRLYGATLPFYDQSWIPDDVVKMR